MRHIEDIFSVAANSRQLIGILMLNRFNLPNPFRNTSLHLAMHFIHFPVAAGCNFNPEFQENYLAVRAV